MRTITTYRAVAASLFTALALTACGGGGGGGGGRSIGGGSCAAPTGAGEMYALTASNKIISFDVSAPSTLVSTASISGLRSGDVPVGLDYRPHDRLLYLLTNNNGTGRLYCVGPDGDANAVATLDEPLDGTHFAVDFNPQRDRLRVIGVGGVTLQNLSVNPATGSVSEDTELTGAPTPRVAAVAYTNTISKVSSVVLQTALYGIDSDANQVVRIGTEPSTDGACPMDTGNPKCGIVDDAGSVPFAVDVDDNVAFDIDGLTGVGYAAMQTASDTASTLYTVNLNNGTVTAAGTIGGGETVKGLTLATQYEANVYAVTETDQLIAFRPGNPNSTTSPDAITGLPPGVTVLGIDFRAADPVAAALGTQVQAANPSLYALGSDGFLYTVNTATGAASKVGTSTTPPVLVGPAWGVDFNANSDRLRVVSEAEENIRFNPNNGIDNSPDPNLTPAGTIAAIAIDRNFVGGSGVTKYGIDTASNKLVTIGEGSGKDGQVTALAGGGALGVDPTSTCAGFDIAGGRNGIVLAALDIGGQSVLHNINLATGAASIVTNSTSTTGVIAGGERVCSLSIEIKKIAP